MTVIPLSPELWTYARQAVPCNFTRGYLYTVWKRAAVAAGARELRLYDLRHAFGQWLVNAGVPQSVVQVGMRHKTAAMTARYVKQRDRGVNAGGRDPVRSAGESRRKSRSNVLAQAGEGSVTADGFNELPASCGAEQEESQTEAYQHGA